MVGIIAVLMILLPVLVSWLSRDMKMSIKTHKSTIAFNLAEAGVDRGMWKLKSSTSTFAQANEGTAIAGYDFNTAYSDINDGKDGTYRIKFSSGPGTRDVTITAEGRDISLKNVRAIKAVYRNQTIPGSIISGGVITWANAFSAHWGPVMAHGNINITDANAAQDYFPRKFSRQVVSATSKGYERDTNGLTPPNTDNKEWWSDYDVPELPILDFAALRSSASTTNTLNVYGCNYKSGKVTITNAAWSPYMCGISSAGANHAIHLQNTWYHPLARKQYCWYWDNSVIFADTTAGATGDHGTGMWGTFIMRGTFVNFAGDNYSYTGPVPTDAWQEYSKIEKAANDTSATNEYPADNGYQKNRSTFKFGSEIWTKGNPPSSAGNTDIGFRGLLYVGGDLDIEGPADINGAVYVVGNISKAVGAERTIVFFDDTLDLPTLNVVLVRQSWDEITPSTTAWP